MRILTAAILMLALMPAWADDTGAVQEEVKVRVAYLGMGQFFYKKVQYDYKGLLAAIQADYLGLHVSYVNVDMGQLAPVSDTMQVCQLKRDLGALVRMHLVVNGVKQELFC